jgi:ABC-type oligopeptide transport system substrate-binding subunit
VHIGNARGTETLTKYKDSTRAALRRAGTNYNLVRVTVNTRKPPFDNREVRQALATTVNQS